MGLCIQAERARRSRCEPASGRMVYRSRRSPCRRRACALLAALRPMPANWYPFATGRLLHTVPCVPLAARYFVNGAIPSQADPPWAAVFRKVGRLGGGRRPCPRLRASRHTGALKDVEPKARREPIAGTNWVDLAICPFRGRQRRPMCIA